MSLNDHGFLGQDVERIRLGIVARHKVYFDLAYKVNDFCQQTKFRLPIHSKDGPEVVAASLLLKMLCDFQAAIIVLERGLVLQGQELLRCALEAFFFVRQVANEPEFAATWAKSDEIDRKRAFEAVKAGGAGLPPGVGAEELEAKLKARIEADTIKRLWLTDIKTETDWQSGLYAHWSLAVHSAPRSAEVYLDKGPPGSGIKGLKWGPSEEDLDFTLGMGVGIILAAWEPISRIYRIEVRAEVDALDAKLRALLAPTLGDLPQGRREDQ